MKTRIVILTVVLIVSGLFAKADNFSCLPYTVSQPDGAVINCFVSGDEYFNWLHDPDGYTIIQADNGYYYYGVTSGGEVVPTTWLAGRTDPAKAGLAQWAKISLEKYNERRAFYSEHSDGSVKAPHTGILNNLVVYIRFSDDTEFTLTRQVYDDKFNPPTGNSLKSYFNETSYSALTISSTHYPECVMTTNSSFQDTHPRSYFQPYNATANPNGYSGNTERTLREHTLLKDAIAWVNANSPVPTGLNTDGDNDGNVDNVCFIIRGGNGAWAELLWAHRWSLFSYNVYINGKRVLDYTFQPESQVAVKTLCHEMFHALGSPDLYHYTSNGISPAGAWDIMDGGSGSMTAYMKWKYTQNAWIATIPAIVKSGTYTLHPLTSPENNCYRIASPYDPDQFFMVEYRKKSGTFEGSLPGSGLIVYRIDPSINGNASGPPDEVYVYRPGGTTVSNGATGIAFFSAGSGRTKINENTNPIPFLQDGTQGGLNISNVTAADTTISFYVKITDVNDPRNFTANPAGMSGIILGWQTNPSGNDVLIAFDTVNSFGVPMTGKTYSTGDTLGGGGSFIYKYAGSEYLHSGLLTNTHYYYKVWSVLPGTSYSTGVTCDAVTLCESVSTLPFTEGFENNLQCPECWYETNIDPVWRFFTGNGPGISTGFPAAAHAGLRNACLMDATVTPDYNTLILPMFIVQGYTDIQLKFWMFMQKWGSRQDELQVFYRGSPVLPWVILQSYSQSISSWTEQTLSIPAGNSQFQIGFGGNAMSGFGICIDDIEISGTPIAFISIFPENRVVSMAAGSTSFDVVCPVGWTATSDAPSWCTVTPSGTGNGTITATYAENPLYAKRIAQILVSGVGIGSGTVTVTQDASNISVEEYGSETISIYPNPAKGFCKIIDVGGSLRINEITLVDIAGKVVLSKKCNGEKEIEADLTRLAPGAYTMKIRGETGGCIRKLTIVR